LLAKNAALSAADAYRLLRDTSAPSSGRGGAVVDACAAMVSLIGRGSCSATTGTEHRVVNVRDQRVGPH
jgi:hypothetical protein